MKNFTSFKSLVDSQQGSPCVSDMSVFNISSNAKGVFRQYKGHRLRLEDVLKKMEYYDEHPDAYDEDEEETLGVGAMLAYSEKNQEYRKQAQPILDKEKRNIIQRNDPAEIKEWNEYLETLLKIDTTMSGDNDDDPDWEYFQKLKI